MIAIVGTLCRQMQHTFPFPFLLSHTFFLQCSPTWQHILPSSRFFSSSPAPHAHYWRRDEPFPSTQSGRDRLVPYILRTYRSVCECRGGHRCLLILSHQEEKKSKEGRNGRRRRRRRRRRGSLSTCCALPPPPPPCRQVLHPTTSTSSTVFSASQFSHHPSTDVSAPLSYTRIAQQQQLLLRPQQCAHRRRSRHRPPHGLPAHRQVRQGASCQSFRHGGGGCPFKFGPLRLGGRESSL